MDIASRPSEPAENVQIADAAPMPQAPPVIRREHYRPPAWLVPEVALDFALGLDETRVVSRLQVRRNGDDRVLRLNGDGIAARVVLVDGQAAGGWRMDGADLLIELPGEAELLGRVHAEAGGLLAVAKRRVEY